MDVWKINVKRKIQVSIFKLPEEEKGCHIIYSTKIRQGIRGGVRGGGEGN